jgi:hypothetical protein
VLSVLLAATLACSWFTPAPTMTPQPTDTPPPPSPTPLPAVPPIVIDRLPEPGAEQAPTAPVVVYFDAPMERASVEGAFTLASADGSGVAGRFAWSDNDSTLTFTPAQPLDRSRTYQAEIAAGVRNTSGLALDTPFTFTFQTVGDLAVTQVYPNLGSGEVAADSVISIAFNRPVVPLTGVADQADLVNPLRLTPAVNGLGEWVTTSLFRFRPAQPLVGGLTYTASIPAGLQDTLGTALPSDFEWTFTIATPALLATNPALDGVNVPLTAVITATFNQPMDHASSEAAFALVGPNGPVDGALRWSDDSRSLGFLPSGLLELGTTYQITFAEGARVTGGEGPAMPATSSAFTTVLPPRLATTDPLAGGVIEPYGTFTLYFDSPMDVTTLGPNISLSPAVTNVYTYWNETDLTYSLSYDLLPGTTYTLALEPGMRDPYGALAFSERQTITFTSGDYPPQVQLGADGPVGFYAADGPTAATLVTRNIDSVDFNLAPVDATTFLAFASGYDTSNLPLDVTRSWSVSPGGARNERMLTPVPLAAQGALAPGLYVMRAEPRPEQGDLTEAVVVSNIQLTFKAGRQTGLAWAIDVRTGQAVANLPLTVWRLDGTRVASARTDADGVATFAWDADLPSYLELAVLSDDPQRVAAASTGWSFGLEPWLFNAEQNYQETPFSAYLVTDRPLYRPGESVEVKGIVRSSSEARYTLPSFQTVDVSVVSPAGEVVFSDTLTLSDFGSFTLALPLPSGAEADLGVYALLVRRAGAEATEPTLGSGTFSVADYRKPEFNVTVTAAADAVVGDTVTAEVDARFFFDLPVSDAQVEWRVFSDPVVFAPDMAGNFSFTDPDDGRTTGTPAGMGLIVEQTGTTDAQGHARLTFTAPAADAGRVLHYDIQAVVSDSTGDVQVAGHASVAVYPSALAVGVAPERYLTTAGSPLAFDVVSLDPSGAPAPNTVVLARLERSDWGCAQVVDAISRQTTWACTETRTPAGDRRLTTDAQGRASASFRPDQAGSYRLATTIQDAAGREARAVAYVFVVGEGEITWRQEPNARIELTTDRRAYQPGDTAEVLIPAPLGPGALALITVERDGVLRHDILELDDAATTYRLPLTADDAPGVFIGVVVVRPGEAPDYRVGLTEIDVSADQQLLTVTATPDRTRAGPGEIVRYTLDVRDASGAPVQAEVSISIADLAALNLAEPNALPIERAFYGPPKLSVRTGLSLNVLGDAVPADMWAIGRGGGGGDGGGGVYELLTPRSNFKDTAFWSGQSVTDADGRLSIEVTLPDNLTTWRLDARAVTVDTRVGSTQVDVIASKSLQIRPITPRFLTAGDRVTLRAAIDNGGAEALDVRVLLDAAGVTLEGPAEQSANVPAGGRVEVAWPVVVTEAEAADLTFTVQGGGQFDSSKPTLGQGADQLIPIARYIAPEAVATAGDLTAAGIRVEAIGVPRRFGAVAADLDVRLTPSLLASFAPALDALEDPESPDTETAAGWSARLSANTAVLRALRVADAQPDLQRVLAGRVTRAVRALNMLQGEDGGWALWPGGLSDEWLSANVVLSLQAVVDLEPDAVPDVLPYMLERGVDFLYGSAYLTEPTAVPLDSAWQLDRQAAIVYALSVSGADVEVLTNALFDVRDRLSPEGQALLALALPKSSQRLRSLIDHLVSIADVSGTSASWAATESTTRLLGTQTRATAIVLRAILWVDPENPLAPNVVRWLMVARRADAWETSQETAWALNALSDWAAQTGELRADFSYSVRLNGNLLLDGVVNADTLDVVAATHTADLTRTQANQLVFERGAGDGRLYYTVALNVVLPAGDAPAVDRGLVVSRSYAIESTTCGATDQPACSAITEARVGDTVRVTVNVSTPRERQFVVLEDLFPAGAEPIDTSLLTAPRTDGVLGLRAAAPDFWWGGWWFAQQTVRADRVRVVAEVLPAGAYTYSYLLYVQTDGVFQVRPAQAYTLYAPEVFGRSTGAVFTVSADR